MTVLHTQRLTILMTLAVVLTVVGCQSSLSDTPTPSPGTAPNLAGNTAGLAVGYTYLSPDGNRVVAGKGDLPNVIPVDIQLDAVPIWLVAAPAGDGTIWAALLSDGRVQAFQVVGDEVAEIAISPDRLPPNTPPALVIENDVPRLVTPPDRASSLTHPVFLLGGAFAYVDAAGAVVVTDGSGESRLAVNALPDARILVDNQQRLLLLTGPTDRYPHGVLGDDIEGSAITMVETVPRLREVVTIPAPEGFVIEGIAPIWTDLDGKPGLEIIVTISNADEGAHIMVFDESGKVMASGPAVGRGSRWRHQIAAGPFGSNGEFEVVDVLTPHIGGVVEFYRLTEDELRIVAQVSGFTSHVIGTRNLDMAIAGDFDGDGQLEVLLPSQSLTELGAVRRTQAGAEAAWTVAVNGRVATNLAAIALPDGRLAVDVGREDGVLRLWLPER